MFEDSRATPGSLIWRGRGSIGRTDLPGGNLRLLKQGIEKKVLNQPATTMIFPGHGPYTNVKNELLTNPFIS